MFYDFYSVNKNKQFGLAVLIRKKITLLVLFRVSRICFLVLFSHAAVLSDKLMYYSRRAEVK